MQDSLSFVAAVIVSVVLLFVYPLFQSLEKQARMTEFLMAQTIVQFVDEARHKGEIGKVMYERFIERMDAMSDRYVLQLEHVHPTRLLQGEQFVAVEEAYYRPQIQRELDRAERYPLQVGDYVSVTVSGGERFPFFIPYGGLVYNEVD